MQVLSEREPDLCGLDHGEKGFMEGLAWDLEGRVTAMDNFSSSAHPTIPSSNTVPLTTADPDAHGRHSFVECRKNPKINFD